MSRVFNELCDLCKNSCDWINYKRCSKCGAHLCDLCYKEQCRKYKTTGDFVSSKKIDNIIADEHDDLWECDLCIEK